MPNTYKSLVVRCAEAGTNLRKVCQKAGVDRNTVQRWKNSEPQTLVILAKLNAAIDEELKAKNDER